MEEGFDGIPRRLECKVTIVRADFQFNFYNVIAAVGGGGLRHMFRDVMLFWELWL